METKALIRKRALQVRDGLTPKERAQKSTRIIHKIIEHDRYQQADSILVYVNYKSEVETTGLIETALKDGKAVYCPRVQGKEMEFYRIHAIQELVDGYKGIREPVENKDKIFVMEETAGKKKSDSLMIMPGSAFDEQRNRIGYGGGYYDKYLEKHPLLYTIALGFQCQIQKSIPADTFDWKPDVIVTECNIYGK